MRSFITMSLSEKSRRIHKVFRYYYDTPSPQAQKLYEQYHAKKEEAVLNQLRSLILSETESDEIHLLLD